MTDSLFQQLKNIGIDDELAHQVSAALDPDHNASKKDFMVLQKAILKVQASTDQRHIELKSELKSEINSVKLEMAHMRMELSKDINNARIEFHSMHRHSIYAFGAILVSIFTVLAVNIYFHL